MKLICQTFLQMVDFILYLTDLLRLTNSKIDSVGFTSYPKH